MQKLTLAIVSAAFVALAMGSGCADDDPAKRIAAAKQFVASKNPSAAMVEIKSALGTDPNLGEARFMLGTLLLGEGNPAGAEVELRKALAAKYPDHLVVPVLARAMLAMGQAAKLVEEFGNKAFVQPDAAASLRTSLALAQATLGKPELAEAALRSALAADPHYAPALLATAQRLAAAKELDAAMRITDEVISREPSNANAWKLKGDLLLYGLNKADDARAAYRKSTEVVPGYAAGNVALMSMFLQLDKLDDASQQLAVIKKYAPSHPMTRYYEAELAYRQKDYKLARDLAKQLLLLAKEDPRLLVLAGSAELQLGALVQAESYFTRAVLAAPGFLTARRLLIVTHLRSGHNAKALAALISSAGGDSLDPSLYWLAGEVYLQNGDAKQAEVYFVRAAKSDPADSRTRTSLAIAQLTKSPSESGFQQLERIAESDTGAMADLALITAHLKRNEFDMALVAVDKLAKKQPDKPLAMQLRGQIQLASKDFTSARKSFEQALAIDPVYFAAIASLAKLDVLEKKPDDAKQRLERLLTKNPKNEQAWLALVELAVARGSGKEEVAALLTKAVDANPTEVKPRLMLVELYIGSKDNKQAMAAAQSAVATLPESPELLTALGRVQQLTGESSQALVTYAKLVPLQPRSPQPHLRIAEVHLANKNKPAAEQSLRKALELEPRLLDAQTALYALLADARKYPEALKIGRTVQEQRPKTPAGYVMEGDVYFAQQNWDAASKAYQSGLLQVPSTLLAVKLHSAHLASGKIPEAYRFATGWTKDHPKDGAFLSHLGDVAVARQDLALAERNYLAALQAQPEHAGALNNLAWVTAQLGKAGAVEYAERAVKAAPQQAAYLDTLATLLADKKDFARAIETQNRALTLQPGNPAMQLNLAKIYTKSGDKAQAKSTLEPLVKLGGEFPRQAEVAMLLKSL